MRRPTSTIGHLLRNRRARFWVLSVNLRRPCLSRQAPFAREAKRAATGRSEGRRSVPEAIEGEARRSPKTGKRRSLRAIAAELTALGHVGPWTALTRGQHPPHAGRLERAPVRTFVLVYLCSQGMNMGSGNWRGGEQKLESQHQKKGSED
jgi:hypothetical protein